MEVLGASALAIASAYAIRRNLKSLHIIPEELQSLLVECSRLEVAIEDIDAIQTALKYEGLASNSRLDHSAIVPILNIAWVDAQKRLGDLHSFIEYMSKKAQENDKGDHWQWIRKKNNIDRLRAELRSIRYDLTVRCSNATPELFDLDLSMVQYTGKDANESKPQQKAKLILHCAKIQDRKCAKLQDCIVSDAIGSQLYEGYQQAEWISAYRQRPRVQAIQASNHSESETCLKAQDSSLSSTRLLQLSCFGQRLPPSLASTPWLRRTGSSIRTCYVLVALGMVSIAGSLALALWRSINNSDIQGGFSIAQYVLAVAALIIGCVLVLHSRNCTCWSSSPSTGGNGTSSEDRPVELQQLGQSESLARHTAESPL